MENTLQVGLIGYGMAGQVFHAPFIFCTNGLHLHKIATQNPANIQIAQTRYPKAQIVAEAVDIISDPMIDLVVIATPNSTHYKLAKEALLAGKHVVVDKPFTITVSEADELIRLAHQRGLILAIFQNRRYDSDFLTVKKILESGVLGRVVSFESRFDRFRNELRPNTWKEVATPGSGALYDLGSHLIDQAIVLFGLPDAIYADLGTQRANASIVDYFNLNLYYEGLQVSLKASMLVKVQLPRFAVLGDQGGFVKYGMDPQENALKQGLLPHLTKNWGIENEENLGTLSTLIEEKDHTRKIKSEMGNYGLFYENVVQSIQAKNTLAIKPFDVLQQIKIIELAYQSAAEKRVIPFEKA